MVDKKERQYTVRQYREERPKLFYTEPSYYMGQGRYHDDREYIYENEAIGTKIIEENEKERALDISHTQEEEELKEEYDRSIMEITKDYRAKLRDLDQNYSQRRHELDADRFEAERNVSKAKTTLARRASYTPAEQPYVLDLHPPIAYNHSPDAQTFNDSDFGFATERPRIGYYLQADPSEADDPEDPMAEIKKIEADLAAEKASRELELKQDYEQRLAELEADFQQKGAEVAKQRRKKAKKMAKQRRKAMELKQQ